MLQKYELNIRYVQEKYLNMSLCVHHAVAFSLIITSDREQAKIYHHEARQMPERMKQEALQLEEVMETVSFPIHFPWRSHLTTVL